MNQQGMIYGDIIEISNTDNIFEIAISPKKKYPVKMGRIIYFFLRYEKFVTP